MYGLTCLRRPFMLLPVTQQLAIDHVVDELVAGGHTLSRAGLVTAFGHLSCRMAEDHVLITPPMPLGRLTAEVDWTELDLSAGELPVGVPREAWIHLTIARRRPDVGAICRAQPPVAAALGSAGVSIVPLHGQGAFVGPRVPVFDDAVLVRDEARAEALAARLGNALGLAVARQRCRHGRRRHRRGRGPHVGTGGLGPHELRRRRSRHTDALVGRRASGLAERRRRDPRADLGRPAPPPAPDHDEQEHSS